MQEEHDIVPFLLFLFVCEENVVYQKYKKCCKINGRERMISLKSILDGTTKYFIFCSFTSLQITWFDRKFSLLV